MFYITKKLLFKYDVVKHIYVDISLLRPYSGGFWIVQYSLNSMIRMGITFIF